MLFATLIEAVARGSLLNEFIYIIAMKYHLDHWFQHTSTALFNELKYHFTGTTQMLCMHYYLDAILYYQLYKSGWLLFIFINITLRHFNHLSSFSYLNCLSIIVSFQPTI